MGLLSQTDLARFARAEVSAPRTPGTGKLNNQGLAPYGRLRDMIEMGEPSHNAAARSPSEHMPQLTINHEVATDPDSSNAFEGPEKLLEVWFALSPTALPRERPQDRQS